MIMASSRAVLVGKEHTISTESVARYTSRDLILYALGIGCGRADDINSGAVIDSKDLRFVYERHKDFQAFPLFPLALVFTAHKKRKGKEESFGNDHKDSISWWGLQPFPPGGNNDGGDEATIASLPKRYIRNHGPDEKELLSKMRPVVQVSQSVRIYRPMPLPLRRRRGGGGGSVDAIDFDQQEVRDRPVTISLRQEIIGVVPKAVGTFVTMKVDYYYCYDDNDDFVDDDNDLLNEVYGAPSTVLQPNQRQILLCTAEFVSLIIGLDPERVIASPPSSSSVHPCAFVRQRMAHIMPTTTTTTGSVAVRHLTVNPDLALLYRLSGDTNPLHVDGKIASSFWEAAPSSSSSRNDRSPRSVLHGLCTLGIAVRMALAYVHGNESSSSTSLPLTHASARFVGPVWVGSRLRLVLWDLGLRNGGDNVDGTRIIPSAKSEVTGGWWLCFRVYACCDDNETEKGFALVVDDGLVGFGEPPHPPVSSLPNEGRGLLLSKL